MAKDIIATNPVDQEFLTQVAAEDSDEILTEAIGAVLWRIVSANAISNGTKLAVPRDVIDEGRSLSRGPILTYVQTHQTIDMTQVETCASQAGSKSADYTLAANPDATAITAKAFHEAWDEISKRIRRARLVAGFAC
ncbi:MAG TPA: hypothetical protein VMR86_17630 [Myxococcota bacterium]|nr:hypothetical protein [Myxococcota bacterium]